MDGVGEQRDRAAEEDDHRLQDGRCQQDEEADFQPADAGTVRLHSIIDRVRSVMRVRHEQPIHKPPKAGRMAVTVAMIVIPVRLVVIVVRVGVVVFVAGCHSLTRSAWWWREAPPSECSAWKMASATSREACSFSKR